MKLVFEPGGWQDYLHWQSNDPKMLQRLKALLQDGLSSPFKGIGKPEPLRNRLSGCWSRRIDGEHRLVYRVMGAGEEQRLEVLRCRFHY